jgi:hypothetical protein
MVALLVMAVSCHGRSTADTITVDGQPVAVARLVDAHAALCEAAAHPDQARTLFFDRSHESLHTVARALDDVDRALAAQLLEAKQAVESALNAGRPVPPDDLLRLAGIYRTGLGRLAITAPPCDK